MAIVIGTNYRFAQWSFAGLATPALDVQTSELPPTHRGALGVPGSVVKIGSAPAVVTNEYSEIERFYFEQGITAADVLKLTAADALARVPVATIRARSFADVPDVPPYFLPGAPPTTARRGTVSTLPGPTRTLDNSSVPAQS